MGRKWYNKYFCVDNVDYYKIIKITTELRLAISYGQGKTAAAEGQVAAALHYKELMNRDRYE